MRIATTVAFPIVVDPSSQIWNVAAPVAHLLWNIGTEFEVSIVFKDPQLFSR